MATAIKTLLLRSIKEAVLGIREFKAVYLNPERGLREEAPKPYCNIFSQPESSTKMDLYRHAEFEVSCHIWVKEDSGTKLDEKLHDLLAQLQMALLPISSGAREYCIYLEESGAAFDTLFFGDNTGVGVATYLIKYRHTYGNPYQLNPQ
jgi:hypothetical protein